MHNIWQIIHEEKMIFWNGFFPWNKDHIQYNMQYLTAHSFYLKNYLKLSLFSEICIIYRLHIFHLLLDDVKSICSYGIMGVWLYLCSDNQMWILCIIVYYVQFASWIVLVFQLQTTSGSFWSLHVAKLLVDVRAIFVVVSMFRQTDVEYVYNSV